MSFFRIVLLVCLSISSTAFSASRSARATSRAAARAAARAGAQTAAPAAAPTGTQTAAPSASPKSDWLSHLALQGHVEAFTGVSLTAHQPFTDLIGAAQTSIFMEMYHLSDPDVAKALEASKARGIDVTVILDQNGLKSGGEQTIGREIAGAGITTIASSPAFSISHTKSVVVDHSRAIISSMNLTSRPEIRRDYGIVLEDPGVIAEMESVFNADVKNAQAGTGDTPPLHDARLLWSPINSNDKLHDLITSANSSIAAVAENVLDATIIADLSAAAKRGVHVEVLSPACPLGGKPDGNYNSSIALQQAGVIVRQMPSPSTPSAPYLHGKMMIVDQARAYAGSINYSFNSLHKARELGIVVEDRGVIDTFSRVFDSDFQAAQPVGAQLPVCP